MGRKKPAEPSAEDRQVHESYLREYARRTGAYERASKMELRKDRFYDTEQQRIYEEEYMRP